MLAVGRAAGFFIGRGPSHPGLTNGGVLDGV
jgi:hypothetical protein